jgi:hypothetical protein
MQQRVRDLYQAPFWYDDICYIRDANHQTVAYWDSRNDFVVRGWGRIRYMEDADDLFNSVISIIVEIKDNEEDPDRIVNLLNRAWK